MDDRALLTIKAFLAAYETHGQPELPELAAIWADLENRAAELHPLALNHPQLRDDYQRARQLLTATASTRKGGVYAVPQPLPETHHQDQDNITRILQILDQKTSDEIREQLPQSPQK